MLLHLGYISSQSYTSSVPLSLFLSSFLRIIGDTTDRVQYSPDHTEKINLLFFFFWFGLFCLQERPGKFENLQENRVEISIIFQEQMKSILWILSLRLKV